MINSGAEAERVRKLGRGDGRRVFSAFIKQGKAENIERIFKNAVGKASREVVGVVSPGESTVAVTCVGSVRSRSVDTHTGGAVIF